MKRKRHKGTKILSFIKKEYAKGSSNREVAELLTPLAKENPEEYAYGDKTEWNAGKVSGYAVKHGIGRGKPGMLADNPPKRVWTKKPTPEFTDIELASKSEPYVFIAVPQSKLATIMEVLK